MTTFYTYPQPTPPSPSHIRPILPTHSDRPSACRPPAIIRVALLAANGVSSRRARRPGGVASGAKTDWAQLRRALARLENSDVLMVTWLDRLAGSTRDLLNTLATVTDRRAGFRSLGDAWADTTTAHGRLMAGTNETASWYA